MRDIEIERDNIMCKNHIISLITYPPLSYLDTQRNCTALIYVPGQLQVLLFAVGAGL